MFEKLYNFFKNLFVPQKKEEKQTDEQQNLRINADRLKYIQEQEKNKPTITHPVTKEQVSPLPNLKTDIKSRVKWMAEQEGFTGDEWNALEKLIHQESTWNPDAVNPSSGAFGLFQIHPKAHPDMVGANTDKQIEWGLNYIKNRYKTPSGALNFWNNEAPKYDFNGDGIPDGNNWY